MMKPQHALITVLIAVCLLASMALAQNRYYVADPEIQALYEHFNGSDLKTAIEGMLSDQYGARDYANNISVQFNNGSESGNSVYIGKNNTLEFLVSNKESLSAVSLGFNFECTKGNFEWVRNFGTITPGDTSALKTIKINEHAFKSDSIWLPICGAKSSLDSIILGGIYMPGGGSPLPAHSKATVLYSMQVKLPDDTSLIGGEFCVDNIFFPAAGDWLFTEISGKSQTPGYNGFGNVSAREPSAPPRCFQIAAANGRDTKKGKFDKSMLNNNSNVLTDEKGGKILKAMMQFNGSDKILYDLGVNIAGQNGNYLSVTFPVNKLPEICQLRGVMKIIPASNKN